LNDISNNYSSYASNYISLILSGQQPFSYISDDIYTALILEESEKLYNKLTTKLTNEIIAATAAMKTVS
jgi:bifunctional pyridoxal-dependent enzyme with beta-cystathionase and maltose regulon repressor activities